MERILFVIEDDHVAGMLQAILNKRVPADAMSTVRSADEAIVYLREHPINALVMEASAQILNRFSLQTLIQHRYPTLPLIVLGGDAATEIAGTPALTIVPAPFSMATVET
ncbi:MAG TPA: hypothetical protein VGE07_06015, partial [Herpetosiphonaceae bacterium]